MKRVTLLLALLPGMALAGQSIDEKTDFPADGRVKVSNVVGVIEVTTWDRNEVHLTGELGDGSELEFRVSGNQLIVEVDVDGGNGRYNNPEESDLYLKVPVSASLDLSAVSADLRIEDSAGESISAEVVSGDVFVRAETRRLELSSVSGDVEFIGSSARSSVESVSGDIELEGIAGEVEVSVVSGDVFLRGASMDLARFESVSGSLELELSVNDGGRLAVESMSGDVTIDLPEDQTGEFRVQTFSGDIRSDFGSPQREKSGPGTRLEFSQGNGDASLRIENFSGDVRLNGN